MKRTIEAWSGKWGAPTYTLLESGKWAHPLYGGREKVFDTLEEAVKVRDEKAALMPNHQVWIHTVVGACVG